jgi:hypothetical protein
MNKFLQVRESAAFKQHLQQRRLHQDQDQNQDNAHSKQGQKSTDGSTGVTNSKKYEVYRYRPSTQKQKQKQEQEHADDGTLSDESDIVVTQDGSANMEGSPKQNINRLLSMESDFKYDPCAEDYLVGKSTLTLKQSGFYLHEVFLYGFVFSFCVNANDLRSTRISVACLLFCLQTSLFGGIFMSLRLTIL